MERNDGYKAYVGQLIESLTEDKMSLIDFDQLKTWLREVSSMFDQTAQQAEELSLLRQDYIDRIAGMAKAVAAVARRSSGLQGIVSYLGTLPSLSAGELINEYRRASARFRDAFPTSFGPPANHGNSHAAKDPTVYK